MKAKKLLSLALASVMTLAAAVTAVSADGDIKVLLNGKELSFDVPPMAVEGRTLVPFRAIFEALGYDVIWDEAEPQLIRGTKGDSIELKMEIGQTTATITNSAEGADEPVKTVTLDVPPMVVDNRTLVPLRAVGEMSGYKVDWLGETNTATIDSPADIITGPGPVVSDDGNLPAEGHGPAMPTQPPNPTTQTEPGPVVSEFPITYDDTNERESHNVRGFELLSVEKNAEGKYDITFTLRTFFEGRGTVAASFDCLDANGSVVDTFSGSYIGSDYAWTPHEDKAAISGNTVKIVFHLDN